MAILAALSGMGALVAGQQYYIVQVQKEMVFDQRTLDNSFLTTMKMGESNSEMDKELGSPEKNNRGSRFEHSCHDS